MPSRPATSAITPKTRKFAMRTIHGAEGSVDGSLETADVTGGMREDKGRRAWWLQETPGQRGDGSKRRQGGGGR